MADTVSGLPTIPALPPAPVTGLPVLSSPPMPFSTAPAPSPAFDLSLAPAPAPAPIASLVLPVKDEGLKSWQIVLIVLVALLILGGGGYFVYVMKFSPPQKISPFK